MSRTNVEGGLGHEKCRLSGSCLRARIVLFVLVLMLALLVSCAGLGPIGGTSKIAVIFDTDICDDIDDMWALAMLVESKEFDVKLITTAVGNTQAKAKVIAKFLEAVGRTDIPIGIGVQHHTNGHRYSAWAEDYDLSAYPGKVYEDGVQAIIDTVMKSRKGIKIVAVGPLPNIAQALKEEPKIAQKAEFVGMHGSVYRGYNNSNEISPEYNVKAYVKSAKVVFAAPWEMTITPLDTCGIIQLKGEKYKKVFECESPAVKALMENYRLWIKNGILEGNKDIEPAELEKRVNERISSISSTLFDTVAIYLAMSTDLVNMERLPIEVTDDGYTKIVEGAKEVNCAIEWKDLGAFEDLLVERVTGE